MDADVVDALKDAIARKVGTSQFKTARGLADLLPEPSRTEEHDRIDEVDRVLG